MRALLFAVLLTVSMLAVSMLTACVVPTRHGPEVIAPPLPPVVEFETDEPYYSYGGYYYYYNNNNWYYSHERRGNWQALPRDRYPREWRYKHRGGGEHERGPGWERHDHD